MMILMIGEGMEEKRPAGCYLGWHAVQGAPRQEGTLGHLEMTANLAQETRHIF